jgi:hypothetical protein
LKIRRKSNIIISIPQIFSKKNHAEPKIYFTKIPVDPEIFANSKTRFSQNKGADTQHARPYNNHFTNIYFTTHPRAGI